LIFLKLNVEVSWQHKQAWRHRHVQLEARRSHDAALKAVPLSSGRGRRRCSGAQSSKRREGAREEPRKGWHSRERERHFRVREDAVVQSRSGLARARIVNEARERDEW
jgi:hypothetical protein